MDGARTGGPGPMAVRGASEQRGSAAVTAAVAVVAALFALFAAVRLFGWERGYPLVPMLAFTPYVLAAGLAAAVGAGLLRRWAPCAVLLLAVAVLAAAVAPRAVPFGTTGAGGPALRVLTLNTLAGNVDPADVVALVRDRDVDVLALQETTPALVDGLTAAGLDALLPHAVDHSSYDVSGSSVHAAFPLSDLGDPGRESGGFNMAHAGAAVPGFDADVEVVSVHPVPPLRPDTVPRWLAGLAALPEARGAGTVRILAGDFNATLDHARMRAVLDTGYVSAARVAGAGLTGTWPADGPVPRVAIDHVLVDASAGVAEVEVLDVDGTDHRAVLAEVSLPAGR
ncbi:endonuclease/exonuclease/phosphatase family protein [Nocardiopsis sp. NPDC050513]|uniref:endonuclease/exonuclease/phosphatase family protein n=1 Tax=Nocardiopsis sp. NPDC050513 TaxID=3364338 RepID=UPI003792F8A8